ncbi:RHS repeat domain-containing protein [Chryseobacterium sp. 8AT]|uniref:RHS repeat domain-containing protein n=2 Tax=Chryseobacterium TaxID=59732 RepID=UPI0012EF546B|nr:RHS repeat-associated core domain-containing protein [Chryseobacterium sp. 8AT]VXB14342.1 hypothetical protein CHRYSEO8AT_150023 [Chryseobacterium sp. 8AT]
MGGYTKTESELDFSGTPKQIKTYHKRLSSDTEKVITENFTYDHQNRLLTHTHQVDSNPMEYLAQNKYNELSQLEYKKVGGTSSNTPLQQIDYAYNIRGWMTKINNPNDLSGGDLFGYEIKYQNPVNTSQSPAKFNGNIAEIDWKTTNDGVMRRYGYQYDGLNRLLKGIYQEPQSSVPQNNFYNEEQSYDLSGNILTLRRNQAAYDGSTALLLDNLNYNYNGNKLTSVTDTSGNYGGYPDVGGNTIDYDANGNMKTQKDKGILQIDYNLLNLPKEVKFDATYIIRNKVTGESEERNVRTNYLYRADGTKLKKKYIYFFNKGNSERIVTTDYLDGFQYTTSYAGLISLNFVPTSEGYFDFEKNKYIYNYSDHLGNVRLSYFHNGSSIEALEENNYYPFGLKHDGYNILNGNPAYTYSYNNKELQTETGMYDYGARFYMPDIGRWGVIDNKAEKYSSMSPYIYAGNNPIAFIDPDGNELILSFATATARESYENLVNSTLGGKYTTEYTRIDGTDTYKVTLNMVNKDASLTKEQQAFSEYYRNIIEAEEKISQKIVENSKYANFGNWITGDIDIADIIELDEVGKGGTSSAGALIHEHEEQYEKAKMGLTNGEPGKTKQDSSVVGGKIYTDYEKAHDKALKAEDKVNGNTRTSAINTSDSNIVNIFKESDKTKTHQVVWFHKSTGKAEVKKTKLP